MLGTVVTGVRTVGAAGNGCGSAWAGADEAGGEGCAARQPDVSRTRIANGPNLSPDTADELLDRIRVRGRALLRGTATGQGVQAPGNSADVLRAYADLDPVNG